MSARKNIFITGTSTGLGRAAVKLFQERGWGVVATMRSPDKETELGELAGVEVLGLDVTRPDQINAAVARSIELMGQIDVVFNNAGYGLAGPFEAMDDDRLDRQLSTNLLGVMRATRAFLPHLRQHGGLVITTTSIGGLIALPFNSAYHATKWALEGWSESMWHELKAVGVGIKTVSPGGIATDFAGRSLDFVQHEAYAEPLGKVLGVFQSGGGDYSTPRAIAEVVYEAATDGKSQLRYLAGDDAKAYFQQRQELGAQAFMEGLNDKFMG